MAEPELTETLRLAQNLARNRGYPVFPCDTDKHPTVKRWPELASTDPEAIAHLWHTRPGPLVGIVTGPRSGISVLDIDPKHPSAFLFWEKNHTRLLPTRAYATRSGGLHLYFQHRSGVTNSQSKIATNVDTRGEGGYIISWWCAGFPCRDPTPPQTWPDWLLNALTRTPTSRLVAPRAAHVNSDRAVAGIVRVLATAPDGQRNSRLFWAACRLAERGFDKDDAEDVLLPALPGQHNPRKDRSTIASGFRSINGRAGL